MIRNNRWLIGVIGTFAGLVFGLLAAGLTAVAFVDIFQILLQMSAKDSAGVIGLLAIIVGIIVGIISSIAILDEGYKTR